MTEDKIYYLVRAGRPTPIAGPFDTLDEAHDYYFRMPNQVKGRELEILIVEVDREDVIETKKAS